MLLMLEAHTHKHIEIHVCMIIKKILSMLSKYQVAYGTTENSPITFLGFPLDGLKRKTDSVGYIMDHTEVWWFQSLNFFLQTMHILSYDLSLKCIYIGWEMFWFCDTSKNV